MVLKAWLEYKSGYKIGRKVQKDEPDQNYKYKISKTAHDKNRALEIQLLKTPKRKKTLINSPYTIYNNKEKNKRLIW